MSRALSNALWATSRLERCAGLQSIKLTRQSRFRLLLSSATQRFVPAVNMSSAPTISAPECLFHPMDFPQKILMGPGPSNAPPRVLGASALPLLGHLHPEFTQIMDEVKQGIQYAFQTQNEWTFAISGTGHAAMEAAVANLLETGEVALVCENGIWGQRFADMVERNGCVAQKLTLPMGQVFSLQQIEEGLKTHKPVMMFITHGESSGGTAQPLEGIGALCRKYNCLLVVDSVAAMGGVPLFMDKQEIDCLYSGSQKVLGAPPGTAPISFSQRARKKVETRSSKVRSYYFDANELANYWGCDAGPRRYHHTGPISSIYALREGLARLAEVGLAESWANHKECSEQLHQGVEQLGLSLLVKDKAVRNPCVTPIMVPQGVAWKDVADYAMKNYRVEISGGLGELAGKVWRIGVMGYNCTPDKIRLVLRAFSEGLVNCGYKPPK
ncbi:alanine--glyoxylate aminotransferase-like [Littorina saxatilis]|uniref:Alanine--glyoxylate aminotransferase n=1 Tax=Littorina saxatilis TaxID=31220 RepID=A0AAN9G4A6_9CAEN